MRTRERFVLFLAVLGLLACNGIRIGGGRDPRDPISLADEVPNLYKLEIWSAHEQYEFGEPVQLRAMVMNLSKKDLKVELETEPIIDIVVFSRTEADAEKVWSQEHPDQVRHTLTLAPNESYVVEWSLTLSQRDRYDISICSNRDSSGLISGNRTYYPDIRIYYGVEKPEEPMP
jgi:hypothetical protein